MTKETRSKPIGIKITPSLKAAIERAAIEDHRTLASFIELAVIEHLQRRGFLPKT